MTGSDTGSKKPVILLVDDERPSLDGATKALKREGFHVYPASNSDEAFTHIANAVLPDIIISDYRLPGMNGVDVIRYVREFLAREVPALVMTGDSSADSIRSTNLSNVDVLRKPFQPDKLVAQIDEALA